MRLHSIDCFRGLALMVVLVDHVDLWAAPAGVFRKWTLMGLGLSDAAEVFVFLSGFTFGWSNSSRVERDGLLSCQRHVLVLAARVYCGYLATVAIVVVLGFVLRNTAASIYPAVNIADTMMLRDALVNALLLKYQPFAVGILCLYVVTLPALPALLAVCRRGQWLAIGVSGMLYVFVQLKPQFNLPAHYGSGWFFNPFAWQLLLVIGMVCGRRVRHGLTAAPCGAAWTTAAVVLVLYGVLVKKAAPLLSDQLAELPVWTSVLWKPPLTSKGVLAPLRLLHFLALAYLVGLATRHWDSDWRHPLARPLILCGRHSLPLYCFGTVLAYLSIVGFRWVGATRLTAFIIGLDACLLQFGVALILEYRAGHSKAQRLHESIRRETSPGPVRAGPSD